MTIKKILTSIALAGALALGGAGCDCDTRNNESHTPDNPSTTQTQPQYQTRNISGKIINVDEDSFPIWAKYGYGGGGANFQYELIRVQDGKGNVKQLLSPMPTGYQVGDDVTFNYTERQSITFSDLWRDYGNHQEGQGDYGGQRGFVLQKGKISMDGLLQ